MVLLKELTLIAFLAITHGANAFYSKDSGVLNLDEGSFKKEILSSEYVSVVEFFAPWCGHCQKLKPDYEKVAKSLKGLAKVAAVDCDEEKNKGLCAQQGIKGFPTLKIFKPSGKKGKPSAEEYQGPRTVKSISDAVIDRIPNHVARVTSSKLDNFLSEKNETAKAILFTSKGVTSALWKALAIDFLGSIIFAQIRDKELEAIEAFGIEKYPTIVVLPGGDKDGIVYDGKVHKDDLFEFFKTIASPAEEPEPSPKPAKKEKKPKKVEEQKPISEEANASTENTETEKVPEPEPEKPKPKVPELIDQAALNEACLSPKSKTCILALTPAEPTSETLQNIYETLLGRTVNAFNLYKLSASSAHAEYLTAKLELAKDTPTIIAINAKRKWVRRFAGNVDSEEDVLAWLDAVRLGDVKKEKLPPGLVVEEKEEEKHDEL